jgi:hypothetical protein
MEIHVQNQLIERGGNFGQKKKMFFVIVGIKN